jgi:hypothetical protein
MLILWLKIWKKLYNLKQIFYLYIKNIYKVYHAIVTNVQNVMNMALWIKMDNVLVVKIRQNYLIVLSKILKNKIY